MRISEYMTELAHTLTLLSALAEPTRLQAVRILGDGAEHCVCELMARLDVGQSRMSRHMKVLKGAGVVIARRDAQWVRYRLDPDLAPEYRAIIRAVLAADNARRKEVA